MFKLNMVANMGAITSLNAYNYIITEEIDMKSVSKYSYLRIYIKQNTAQMPLRISKMASKTASK